jgi:hypothetical protein
MRLLAGAWVWRALTTAVGLLAWCAGLTRLCPALPLRRTSLLRFAVQIFLEVTFPILPRRVRLFAVAGIGICH